MAKKKRIGIVISNKSHKTIVVAVQIKYQHPKYIKTLTKSKKFMAHDEHNLCCLGDIVVIEESSPFSKCKSWVLTKIIKSYLNQA